MLSNIQQYESILISCKYNCENKKQFAVIGNIVYKDTSSICRSALHSGFVNQSNYDQTLEIFFKQQIEKYEGIYQNGIQSEQYSMQMGLESEYSMELRDDSFSFIFSPVIQKCQYQRIVDQINSIFEDRKRKENCNEKNQNQKQEGQI